MIIHITQRSDKSFGYDLSKNLLNLYGVSCSMNGFEDNNPSYTRMYVAPDWLPVIADGRLNGPFNRVAVSYDALYSESTICICLKSHEFIFGE